MWLLDPVAACSHGDRLINYLALIVGVHSRALHQAERKLQGSSALVSDPAWDLSAVQGFVGVSGAYDMVALADHLDRRGLYKSVILRIMSLNGVPALRQLSPVFALQDGPKDIR